ncbi:MAG: bifunctional phosphopantothenoylcysteine decarboxylase/phosphopantothenate--cysteine ligase CoaBC [Deltaproteobacteria bacterium HGW-Deltaproteobacteria-12]|jgi:phosphopantothenoylcysteine decarboxylase/phosphopantothenate--cysteine ligase|nr:MAG: bifunctional phosphopantothenoylcysteine decarboxylase/phosphopantothenate--cysteine ligase CoaBC [Deltaproteobacteria bacterium HGW-Deltaproteobacteria-12]
MLSGKKIVLGVAGGIAAYKAAELTRALIKEGAQVKVIMTKSAGEFISPLTFQTLSGNMVYTDMFVPTAKYDMAHISLAEFADAFVIAPATGNIIGKIAAGIGDDLLTTTIMASDKPTLICPAMNDKMLANPLVQDNINRLKKYGYVIMDSGYGELACKTQGAGRLPDASAIVEEIETLLTPKDLTGQKILVTAGPTEEPFDPVRFITNSSSGKMGYALARVARRRGAEVTLITGPTDLPLPPCKKVVQIRTAQEMYAAVLEHFKKSTVVIKAAAVADYRPAVLAKEKIKKNNQPFPLMLERNPDIIAQIGKSKGNRILVGFAMETENLLANAREKLHKKKLDFIVANNLREDGAGFQTDTNIITIIDTSGKAESFPKMTKIEAADKILDRIKEAIRRKGKSKK